MGRLGLGVLAALSLAPAARAQESFPIQQSPVENAANARCAAMGAGFFAVTGSSACMRISGHISAGVGFATGGAFAHPAASATTGSFTEEGASADARFDTPLGPGRIYVRVGDVNGSRWLVDGQ
ncbi:MAG TPA: hypothetical protein VKS78_03095 [Roseiarcus sp.]|nr:hypothetical protein [Roseiarcus sp.]